MLNGPWWERCWLWSKCPFIKPFWYFLLTHAQTCFGGINSIGIQGERGRAFAYKIALKIRRNFQYHICFVCRHLPVSHVSGRELVYVEVARCPQFGGKLSWSGRMVMVHYRKRQVFNFIIGCIRNCAGIKVQIWGDGLVSVEARRAFSGAKKPTSNEKWGQTSPPNLNLYSSTVPKRATASALQALPIAIPSWVYCGRFGGILFGLERRRCAWM